MTRARSPDTTGAVIRDGVNLGYEVYGEGSRTVLLLPTWTIIHSRFWKMQVPYLARRYRVVTYDGPGNGRSDRVTDPARYSADAYAADALAILDECGVESAIVVGLSLGGQYATRLAWLAPDRVDGLVLIGPALPLSQDPKRASIGENFSEPYPDDPQGWQKYNLAYWHDHYHDFTRFFFDQVFNEDHSTKPREDAVGWAAETGPDVLSAEAGRPRVDFDGTRSSVTVADDAVAAWSRLLRELTCPVLVVHGTRDRIQPHATGVETARLTGGTLVSFEGSGHMPNVRDPVRFNLLLKDFVEGINP
jgi:pimeloyl-ACP methyl ester carboxylesterase